MHSLLGRCVEATRTPIPGAGQLRPQVHGGVMEGVDQAGGNLVVRDDASAMVRRHFDLI